MVAKSASKRRNKAMFTNKKIKLDRETHVKLSRLPIKIPIFERIQWKVTLKE